MVVVRLTQLIVANQIAGALWVILATVVLGHPLAAPAAEWLGVAIGLAVVIGGARALRGSRAGLGAVAAVLALQIVAVANSRMAWQLSLGASWRVMFQPRADAGVLGFEGLFSVMPWPAGGGSLFEVNVTALAASVFLLTRLYRTRMAG